MKKAELEKIKKIAIHAAHEAGKIHMKYYRKGIAVREKARSSLVTECDEKSEELIKKLLHKKFPSFQFLGEEGGNKGNSDPTVPTWHVDPLDGTTNFVHGFPMFCVSIGLAIGNEPILGVIHIATLGETFHAAKGCGAFFQRKKMKVSKRSQVSESLLTTGFAYLKSQEKLTPEIIRFQRAHLEARAVRRPGAAAIDLAYVAAGIFDGFWERNLASWDLCAGVALIREAGGKVTNYSGEEFKLSSHEVLATNGKIHSQMIELLV